MDDASSLFEPAGRVATWHPEHRGLWCIGQGRRAAGGGSSRASAATSTSDRSKPRGLSGALLRDVLVGVVGHQHGRDDGYDRASGNVGGNRIT
jgi:hypothetical protein